jgi:hypothetical protein
MKAQLKKITPLYQLYLYLFKTRKKIIDWVTIPDYTVKRKAIIEMASKYKYSDVFVETGTYMGDTVAYLQPNFLKLISIELSKELAEKAQKRFAGDEKVQIIQGDSATQLSNILISISTPVVFWLDGHYSSEFWSGDQYIITAKSEKETPILDELSQIAKHPIKNHIILIDDARLFKGENDYPEISVVKNFVQKNFPNHSMLIKKDIIRILPPYYKNW